MRDEVVGPVLCHLESALDQGLGDGHFCDLAGVQIPKKIAVGDGGDRPVADPELHSQHDQQGRPEVPEIVLMPLFHGAGPLFWPR